MRTTTLLFVASFALGQVLASDALVLTNETDADGERMIVRRQDNPRVPVFTTCKKTKQIALTFDDGPYAYTASLSDSLSRNAAHGSFYVNGNNYGCIYAPESVAGLQAAYRAGHEISSHTWSHVDITTLTEAQFHKQLVYIETALKRILGVTPALFRPPFGRYNDMNLRVLKKRGYHGLVLWDHDAGDTTGSPASASVAGYRSLAQTYPKGHIALNHETKRDTAQTVIPAAVKELKKKGYKLVSVSECLGIEPYQAVGKPKKRDSTWTCTGLPAPGAKA